jgi:uncharacterized protein (DUF486 family)
VLSVRTVVLLIASNLFMTVAWYGHLKYPRASLWVTILVSWLIALAEYALQVPANRIGQENYHFTPTQLKVIQEVVSLLVFAAFAYFYFSEVPTWRAALAFVLVALAVFLVLPPSFSRPHEAPAPAAPVAPGMPTPRRAAARSGRRSRVEPPRSARGSPLRGGAPSLPSWHFSYHATCPLPSRRAGFRPQSRPLTTAASPLLCSCVAHGSPVAREDHPMALNNRVRRYWRNPSSLHPPAGAARPRTRRPSRRETPSPGDVRFHALLHERLMALPRRRRGLWAKIWRFFAGD